MARMMVAKPRMREGRGIGERLAEIVVYIALIGAIGYGARYYFVVYLRSPSHMLQGFIGSVKSGDNERQYEMLSASAKARMKPSEYEERYPLAHGLAERIASFTITNESVKDNRAEMDVTVSVRKSGQELYQTGTDAYRDHYVLVREPDGWKVALDDPKTNLGSLKAAGPTR